MLKAKFNVNWRSNTNNLLLTWIFVINSQEKIELINVLTTNATIGAVCLHRALQFGGDIPPVGFPSGQSHLLCCCAWLFSFGKEEGDTV